MFNADIKEMYNMLNDSVIGRFLMVMMLASSLLLVACFVVISIIGGPAIRFMFTYPIIIGLVIRLIIWDFQRKYPV